MSLKSSNKFGEEVHRLIDYFRQEFRLSYAEMIGTLEIVKDDLMQELRELNEQEQEEDDE